MISRLTLKLLPAQAADDATVRATTARTLGVQEEELVAVLRQKMSIDARSRQPYINLTVEAYIGEAPQPQPNLTESYPDVHHAPKVLIVGAGPAGYFAALELISLGLKPIVLERGKDVRARRRDLKAIQQDGIVHPHSNYCFGEGGAGTYSDGKLYTRSKKRGEIEQVLRLLVEHGATPEIMYDSHPHIGSNKLPNVVAAIRDTIEKHGGEIHFDSFVTDFIYENQHLKGVVVNHGEKEYTGEATILVTGHSARDIFELLHRKQILIEAKPFALGVRVEHPQGIIDQAQYHQPVRDQYLPAASYSLSCQVRERGVYSFCMCPGGLIVPAATSPGELVVNGMSMSRRDSPFANSGMVVSVEMEDLVPFKHEGVFAALAFQRHVEQTLFNAGDGSQKAPAQRLTDFVEGKNSSSINPMSYIPGGWSAPMHELLPKGIAGRLREGLKQFGKQMRGYYTDQANIIGTESRTSSPVRIPRDAETLMHPQAQGLFPGGEGAGYAGGIMSAAMDGQNLARAVAKYVSIDKV